METLNSIIDFLSWFAGAKVLLLAVAATLIMYFVFKKKDELSQHAIQNTAATIVVTGANLLAAIFLYGEINEAAQSAYNFLGVPKLNPQVWTDTPFWLMCVVGIVAKDFADYVVHRLMHTKWGWPTHAAHHSDTFVNAFTTYRVHFIEPILMFLNYIVMLTWLQIPETIPVIAVLLTLHNMYVHINVGIDHGPFKYLIASPVFHRWHHADVPEAHGKNLANVMPIYDVIFGTYYVPGRCREKMGALESGIEDKNPVLILIYPFQEWARLIRQSVKRARLARKRRTAPEEQSANVTPAE